MESRGQQGFTETTRTAQEHVLILVGKIIHISCLVDIQITTFDDLVKCLYPDRILYSLRLHSL